MRHFAGGLACYVILLAAVEPVSAQTAPPISVVGSYQGVRDAGGQPSTGWVVGVSHMAERVGHPRCAATAHRRTTRCWSSCATTSCNPPSSRARWPTPSHCCVRPRANWTPSAELEQQARAVDGELANLAKAVAAGGQLPTLIALIKEREQQRDQLREQAAAVSQMRDVGQLRPGG
jgi:hypothetical protein